MVSFALTVFAISTATRVQLHGSVIHPQQTRKLMGDLWHDLGAKSESDSIWDSIWAPATLTHDDSIWTSDTTGSKDLWGGISDTINAPPTTQGLSAWDFIPKGDEVNGLSASDPGVVGAINLEDFNLAGAAGFANVTAADGTAFEVAYTTQGNTPDGSMELDTQSSAGEVGASSSDANAAQIYSLVCSGAEGQCVITTGDAAAAAQAQRFRRRALAGRGENHPMRKALVGKAVAAAVIGIVKVAAIGVARAAPGMLRAGARVGAAAARAAAQGTLRAALRLGKAIQGAITKASRKVYKCFSNGICRDITEEIAPDVIETVAEHAFQAQVAEYEALKNRDGICLDAGKTCHSGNCDGARVHMWSCVPNHPNQEFRFDVSTGLIRAIGGTRCLDAPENKNLGKVHMWNCDANNNNQRWVYDGATGQFKHNRLRDGKEMCLDASERSKVGGNVLLWQCESNNSNQQWYFAKLRSGRR